MRENICKLLIRSRDSCGIDEELLQLSNTKTHLPILKWAKALNRPFSKGNAQMAKK
jgi:hypothetical protein